MTKKMSQEDIDHEVELMSLIMKVKEARKKEKRFGPISYVYVMVANTDEQYKENLPKPGHVNENGLDTRYRTHIKIGKSTNPILRRDELVQNLGTKNDHVHPPNVSNLDLWLVTPGNTSVEKFIRKAIATRWSPLKETGEYLTYTGYWEDWIEDFEQFCEEELEMINHKILEHIAYLQKQPKDVDFGTFLSGLKATMNLDQHPEVEKIIKFLGEIDAKLLVGAYPQQVFSEGRLPGSRRNSKPSDPIGISSISINRSREHGRSGPVIH